MCRGGAWGQEVHQTSHAAVQREIAVKKKKKAVNALSLLAGEFFLFLFPQGPVPTQG